LAEGIGTSWGDEEEVGLVGELDVAGLPRVFLVFQ